MTNHNTIHGFETAPVGAPIAPLGSEPVALNLRAAYEQTLAVAQALAVDDLLPVNVDLPTAVNTAIGRMPQILALRERVKEELPKFDVSLFDRLEQYALAAGHSHTRFLTASTPPQALADLNTQGLALRDILYKDAVALAARGLIPGDRIGDFKSSVGYKNLTYDLLGLADNCARRCHRAGPPGRFSVRRRVSHGKSTRAVPGQHARAGRRGCRG